MATPVPLRTWNRQDLAEVLIVDSVGAEYDITAAVREIGFRIRSAPVAMVSAGPDITGSTAGPPEPGEVTMTLDTHNLTKTDVDSAPTLLDVLLQQGTGTTYVPFSRFGAGPYLAQPTGKVAFAVVFRIAAPVGGSQSQRVTLGALLDVSQAISIPTGAGETASIPVTGLVEARNGTTYCKMEAV